MHIFVFAIPVVDFIVCTHFFCSSIWISFEKSVYLSVCENFYNKSHISNEPKIMWMEEISKSTYPWKSLPYYTHMNMPIRIYCLAVGEIIHFILQKMVIIQIYITWKWYTFILDNVWLANSINKIFNRLSLPCIWISVESCISPKVDMECLQRLMVRYNTKYSEEWNVLILTVSTFFRCFIFKMLHLVFHILPLIRSIRLLKLFWSANNSLNPHFQCPES